MSEERGHGEGAGANCTLAETDTWVRFREKPMNLCTCVGEEREDGESLNLPGLHPRAANHSLDTFLLKEKNTVCTVLSDVSSVPVQHGIIALLPTLTNYRGLSTSRPPLICPCLFLDRKVCSRTPSEGVVPGRSVDLL